MKKKIFLNVCILFTIIHITTCLFLFLKETESQVPQDYNNNINVNIKDFMSRKIYIVSPKDKNTNNFILYFHGGAYMAEMTESHWNFLQNLSKDTKSTIIVPDYPLSPKYTYKDVLKMSQSLYTEIINKIDTDKLILMGDSAGGGLALGLEEFLSTNNIKLPYKTILISPWLDISMSNPEIKKVQQYDKDLNKFKLKIAGFFYSRWIKEEDKYFVIPLNGDFSKLKNITIFTGTYDILNPDCHLLQERAQNVGVTVSLKEYEKASHIWIINKNDNIANQAYNDLLVEIGE